MSDLQRTELRRQSIGFVFQSFRLFRSLSAVDNVAMLAQPSADGSPRELARSRLCSLGLHKKLHLRPGELSGGERQRVAIARALMMNPTILLADEPTAWLDSSSSQQICHLLYNLAVQDGRVIVVVSHDDRLNSFASRKIHLADGKVIDDTGELQ
jgi:putative ABC transport system ATP-binding protein